MPSGESFVRQMLYNALAANARNAPDRVGFNGSDINDPDLYVPELVQTIDSIDVCEVVAGPGIEPGTQGFSVLCSTN